MFSINTTRHETQNLDSNDKETNMDRTDLSNHETRNLDFNPKENTMTSFISSYSENRTLSFVLGALLMMMSLITVSTASAQSSGDHFNLRPQLILDPIHSRDTIYGDAYGHCKLGEEVFTTLVSGEVSDFQSVLNVPSSDFLALKAIANSERKDDPCLTEATFGRLPGLTVLGMTMLPEERSVTLNACGGTARDKIEVGATPFTPDGVFIGSIAVWTNGRTNADERRLKGLSVKPRTINEDCEVSPGVASGDLDDGLGDSSHEQGGTTIAWEEEDTRTHAKDLYDRRFCRAGQVATGLILHRGERGVFGVQLECRDVLRR